jgi:hypothetical protein
MGASPAEQLRGRPIWREAHCERLLKAKASPMPDGHRHEAKTVALHDHGVCQRVYAFCDHPLAESDNGAATGIPDL